ncbi:60S ribosomal protein L7-3 [Vitis vinifera]|uniref:60S ribosomal protein L7-3 n=1 Tax=Vitis vinifera TaxID=29760 RepID=A0A438DN84_VITVI|nr:60S ribosomal protein L7-3 [Vitis vinifera]
MSNGQRPTYWINCENVVLHCTSGFLMGLMLMGYPNLKNVRELIYKKGFAKIEGQKVPLTDNNIIEQALGKHGIMCIEDIVHEIANVGPHFKEVNSFLWPFTLNKPEGGFQGKKKLFKEGGDAGNRGDKSMN